MCAKCCFDSGAGSRWWVRQLVKGGDESVKEALFTRPQECKPLIFEKVWIDVVGID